MAQLQFDEKRAEQMEVVYRSADIRRRRRIVHELLGARPGDRLLDAGCGPGFYVMELLERVGPEGSVVGVDASPDMLAFAARRAEGRPNVAFHEADVRALPAEDGSFDGAICIQVLEYLDDVDAALRELRRVLRPGGRAVLWAVDWTTLSWHSKDRDRMDRMLRAWDEHLADPALPRTLAAAMRRAGFDDVVAQGHAFASAEFSPEVYCVALLPLIGDYLATIVDPAEASAWVDEQRALGERGKFYCSCTQFGFAGSAA